MPLTPTHPTFTLQIFLDFPFFLFNFWLFFEYFSFSFSQFDFCNSGRMTKFLHGQSEMQMTALTGRKGAKLTQVSSEYQLANIEIFCTSWSTSISIVPILLGTIDFRRVQWRTLETIIYWSSILYWEFSQVLIAQVSVWSYFSAVE